MRPPSSHSLGLSILKMCGWVACLHSTDSSWGNSTLSSVPFAYLESYVCMLRIFLLVTWIQLAAVLKPEPCRTSAPRKHPHILMDSLTFWGLSLLLKVRMPCWCILYGTKCFYSPSSYVVLGNLAGVAIANVILVLKQLRTESAISLLALSPLLV